MAADYHDSLVSLLDASGIIQDATGTIPVYYEAFDKEKNVPCITYLEVSNPEIAHGDTIAYSDTAYQIKVWAATIAELQSIFLGIDSRMRAAGFTRTLATEGSDNGLLYKLLRYNGIAYETQTIT